MKSCCVWPSPAMLSCMPREKDGAVSAMLRRSATGHGFVSASEEEIGNYRQNRVVYNIISDL